MSPETLTAKGNGKRTKVTLLHSSHEADLHFLCHRNMEFSFLNSLKQKLECSTDQQVHTYRMATGVSGQRTLPPCSRVQLRAGEGVQAAGSSDSRAWGSLEAPGAPS